MLAIQWPGADPIKFPSNVTTWTLHGLWATRSDGTWPSNCDPSDYLSQEQIEPIESQIMKYWLSYKQDSFSFWSHEWSTHGTCAKGHSGIDGQLSFFTDVINLLKSVNIDSVFSNAGIIPTRSQNYTINQFNDAAKKALGVDLCYRCETPGRREVDGSAVRSSTGHNNLGDIFMCVDMNLKLMSCPASIYKNYKSKQFCGDADPITYLPIAH
jgi:ribonuclease T2